MKKAKIEQVRPAGENHQVVTVTGGSGLYRRTPCETCPWRKDATGEFPAEAFKHSAPTAYDMADHVFACHSSGSERPAICAGFILNGSGHNLSVRMKLAGKKINLHEVSDGGNGLYESYRAMAVGNGVDPEDPVLKPCRD